MAQKSLKIWLDETGTTQAAFGALGGWSQARISDWSSGRVMPRADVIAKIEDLTGGEVTLRSWVHQQDTAA